MCCFRNGVSVVWCLWVYLSLICLVCKLCVILCVNLCGRLMSWMCILFGGCCDGMG